MLNNEVYTQVALKEDKYKVDESLFFFYFSSFEESRVKVKVEALEDIA